MVDRAKMPVLVECKFDSYKWHNTSKTAGKELIGARHLEEVLLALDSAIGAVNSVTFGVPNRTNRFLPAVNLIDSSAVIRRAKSRIERAVNDLKLNWGDVKNDAQNRLGCLYEESEFPDPSQLYELYGLNFEIICHDDLISTLDFYREYSLYYVDPPELDVYEPLK
jgi:hypothetical protein